MKVVYLYGGKHIDMFLQPFNRNEMTGYIKHQASILETRAVTDIYHRNAPYCMADLMTGFYFCRKKLHQCRHTIKQSAQRRGFDIDSVLLYREEIGFGSQFRVKTFPDIPVNRQIDGIFYLFICHFHVHSR